MSSDNAKGISNAAGDMQRITEDAQHVADTRCTVCGVTHKGAENIKICN